MIAFLDAGDAAAHVNHNTRTFVTEDRGEKTFRIGARQGEFIGVTYAGRLDLDQHLALAGAFELNGGDLERFTGCDGDGGANIHELNLCACLAWVCVFERMAQRICSLPDTIGSGKQLRK